MELLLKWFMWHSWHSFFFSVKAILFIINLSHHPDHKFSIIFMPVAKVRHSRTSILLSFIHVLVYRFEKCIVCIGKYHTSECQSFFWFYCSCTYLKPHPNWAMKLSSLPQIVKIILDATRSIQIKLFTSLETIVSHSSIHWPRL